MRKAGNKSPEEICLESWEDGSKHTDTDTDTDTHIHIDILLLKILRC